MLGDPADEPAGEAVACARRVDDRLQRIRRQREEPGRGDQRRPVLALLGDDDDGPHVRTSRAADTRFGFSVSWRSSASLRITQSTRSMTSTRSSRAMSIHRFIESIAVKRGPSHCSSTLELQRGWMFARKRTSHARAASESFGWKVLEDVELRVEGLARVQVPAVLALPEEGLAAGDALDVVDARAAGGEDREILVPEVVADGPDGAHLVEERRGQREVRGGAAEHALALAERRLDRVVGDRADDRDAHAVTASRHQAGRLAQRVGLVGLLPREVRRRRGRSGRRRRSSGRSGRCRSSSSRKAPGRRSKCSSTSSAILPRPIFSVPKVSTITQTGCATPIA